MSTPTTLPEALQVIGRLRAEIERMVDHLADAVEQRTVIERDLAAARAASITPQAWDAERAELAALVAGIRMYVIGHDLAIGECAAWNEIKDRLGVGISTDADRARWQAFLAARRAEELTT